MTFDLLQILIAVFGVSSIVLLALQRVLLGCLSALICYGVWIVVAFDAGQPGAIAVLAVSSAVHALGAFARLPRRLVPRDEDDSQLDQTDSRRFRIMDGE